MCVSARAGSLALLADILERPRAVEVVPVDVFIFVPHTDLHLQELRPRSGRNGAIDWLLNGCCANRRNEVPGLGLFLGLGVLARRTSGRYHCAVYNLSHQ